MWAFACSQKNTKKTKKKKNNKKKKKHKTPDSLNTKTKNGASFNQ